MSDRVAFEAWAHKRPLDIARQGDTYRFHYTILAWDAWQSACAACATECLDVVNQHTESGHIGAMRGAEDCLDAVRAIAE